MSGACWTIAVFSGGLLLGVLPAEAQAPDPTPPDASAGSPSLPADSTLASPPAAPAAPPGSIEPGVPPGGYPYPPSGPAAAPYGYPPGYAYPPPGYPAYPPGYPQYPPAYQPYPAVPPPPEPPPAPPAPLPTGKWRIGGTLLLIPQVGAPWHLSYLSYDLRVRGESLLAHAGDIKTTGGIALFAELDLIRHVHLALAVQLLPWLEWQSTPTATRSDPFVGTAREVDFFPQFGATFSPARRLRILAYVAPGYSLLATSDMADMLANSGTPHGFALQLGGGILYALGQRGFFSARLSEQWAFLANQVHSNTTGETADLYFRFRCLALQSSVGLWF